MYSITEYQYIMNKIRWYKNTWYWCMLYSDMHLNMGLDMKLWHSALHWIMRKIYVF